MANRNIYVPQPTPKQSQIVDIDLYGIAGNDAMYLRLNKDSKGIKTWYRLLELSVLLSTDATVANRTIIGNMVHYDDQGGHSYDFCNLVTGNITASNTGKMIWSNQGQSTDLSLYNIQGGIQHLPAQGLLMNSNDILLVTIGTGQAGDSYQVFARLEYLNNKLSIQER